MATTNGEGRPLMPPGNHEDGLQSEESSQNTATIVEEEEEEVGYCSWNRYEADSCCGCYDVQVKFTSSDKHESIKVNFSLCSHRSVPKSLPSWALFRALPTACPSAPLGNTHFARLVAILLCILD